MQEHGDSQAAYASAQQAGQVLQGLDGSAGKPAQAGALAGLQGQIDAGLLLELLPSTASQAQRLLMLCHLILQVGPDCLVIVTGLEVAPSRWRPAVKGPKSASDGIRPYQVSVSVRQKSDRCRAGAEAMYLPLGCRCNRLSVPCLAAGRVLGISDCIEQGTGSLQHPLLLTGP